LKQKEKDKIIYFLVIELNSRSMEKDTPDEKTMDCLEFIARVVSPVPDKVQAMVRCRELDIDHCPM
jgi:hypothetical protein